MADYKRALKWPIVSLVAFDIVAVLVSLVPGVLAIFTPDVAALLTLPFGLWAGYKIVEFKGKYVDAIAAGVILGAICFVLCILGFGFALGLGIAGSVPIGVFLGSINLVGALVGGGYALTK